MTKQELQDWLAKHGGLDDTATTRSQAGQDIIFAKDGSRVVLTRVTPDTYRVDDITEKDAEGNVTATAPAAQQPAAPDAAPATTAPAAPAQPSSGVGPTSKEALEGRVGQTPGLVYQGQKLVPKTIPARFAGQPDQHIQVPTVTWVNPATGYTISAEVGPNGDTYTVTTDAVVEANMQPNAPGAKKTPPSGKPYIDDGPEAGETGRRWGWNPDTGTYDRDLGSSPAAQAATRGQSSRTPAQGHPGYSVVKTVKNGQEETHIEKDDNPGVAVQLPTTKQYSQTKQDQTSGKWWGLTAEGKWEEIAGGPDTTGKKYTEIKQDPNTGKWSGLTPQGTWEAIEGGPGVAGNQPLPAGLPQYRPDPNATDGAFGVVDYTNQLAALRSQRNPDGTQKLTDAQFVQLTNLAHQQATSAASRLDTVVRAQQTAQANAINQRNADQTASVNRLTAANSATKDALDTSLKMAGAFTPKSYAAAGGPMFSAVMGIQDMRANQWGGTYQPQPIGTAGYPALDQVVGMGLVPGQTPTVPPVATLTGQPAAPVAPTPPNAIGLGGIGSVVAPGAVRPSLDTPVASGFDPAAAAAAEAARRQQTAASVPPPTPATVVAPSQLGQGQDLSTPVQMAPPQQQQMMAMAGPQPQQPMIPAVNTLGIMASLGHKYSPEVLRQAAAELGW